MRHLRLLKWLLGILFIILLLVVIFWLVFIPAAKESGYQFVMTWGKQGSAPGQFHDPNGIAVASGKVFVADSRNNRIQVFDLNGNFIRQFGMPGKGLGKLKRPMNLTIYNNQLYVPEYFNDHIQVFSLDGTPKRIIGKAGNGPGQFDAPGGVAIAPNGDLFVADFYNQRIQQLDANGTFVCQWGAVFVKRVVALFDFF